MRAIERARCTTDVDIIVIDGYVWLNEQAPGLGAHVYESFGGQVAVIGVAKSAFRSESAIAVERGQSRQPLFVTAAGIAPSRAAELVRSMHGVYRIPTLLRRVDQLARRNGLSAIAGNS
jgi:deoxyribonuclease V